MTECNIAYKTMCDNLVKRFDNRNLFIGWYGPYIGKKYAEQGNAGKRIVVIGAAWWYDLDSADWYPSNIYWTMNRFGNYSDMIDDSDSGYQIEKPSSFFQNLKRNVDEFYTSAGYYHNRSKIGLPTNMEDAIGVTSNVEKDVFGVVERLEKAFKTLDLDLDRESIVYHRFNVRPFEEPLFLELGLAERDGIPDNLKNLKSNILKIAKKDAKMACDVMDDVLRICKPDMVIFDCYRSMLNVAEALKFVRNCTLDEYMHSLNASYFGLHNLFVEEPVYWSASRMRIKNGCVVSIFDQLGIDEKEMKKKFGFPERKDEHVNTVSWFDSHTVPLDHEDDSEACLDIDMSLIDEIFDAIIRIELLAEDLSEGLVKGAENEIDEALANLSEIEQEEFFSALMDNAVAKLGPPIEELREGVNIDAFKFESNGVKIENTEHTELEEFLIHELECHGKYEQAILAKKQGNILSDPECSDNEILRRSLSCLTQMMLNAIRKQQAAYKGRVGSYVKPGSEKGVEARAKRAREAKAEKKD